MYVYNLFDFIKLSFVFFFSNEIYHFNEIVKRMYIVI